MRDRELDTLLRRVHAPAAGDDPRRERLRAELVAAHRRRHPRKQRWNIMTHKTWFRPVVAGLALLVLGVAACTTPTEYDVQMGQQVTLGLDGADKAASEATIQEVAAWLEGREGVEGIMVGIEEIAGGPLTANMTVWGQSLDGAALQADLAAAFPALAAADVTVEALAGTVDGHRAAHQHRARRRADRGRRRGRRRGREGHRGQEGPLTRETTVGRGPVPAGPRRFFARPLFS
jgi:hypothetical protein